MRIFVVGDSGPEHNNVISIHRTYEGALKAWNRRRLELIEEAQSYLKSMTSESEKEMYERIIKNLSCEDPERIDNYPQETPYITEKKLQE
ncbi:hypothetical protein J4219_03420 [Candidatus Woesearchaeota archaeon]|nr:hypothetical protein [Candidatus Woesearchaeota archaeon]